jgi:predicted nucleotidyltransferase
MRLSAQDANDIRQAVTDIFGPEARVRLFGSRTDDAALGGDIDLYIETNAPSQNRLEKTLKLEARLLRLLGERRFDVVVRDPDTHWQPIHQKAREQGVLL